MSMSLDELIVRMQQTGEPVTVTHCGSASRCLGRFAEMQLRDTIAGKRVWTIGCNTRSDADIVAMGTGIDKTGLGVLHLWKIHGSQEVLILNVTDDGDLYIGESTARELAYAERLGLRVRFYSEENPETWQCPEGGRA